MSEIQLILRLFHTEISFKRYTVGKFGVNYTIQYCKYYCPILYQSLRKNCNNWQLTTTAYLYTFTQQLCLLAGKKYSQKTQRFTFSFMCLGFSPNSGDKINTMLFHIAKNELQINENLSWWIFQGNTEYQVVFPWKITWY